MEAGKLIYKVQADMAEFKGQLNRIEQQGQKSTRTFKDVFSGIGGAAVLAGVGVTALAAGIMKCANAAGIQEREEMKLSQVIKSTGMAAGVSSDEMIKLAQSLQSVTEFGDEAIISAESVLLTFTQIGKEVIPQATETLLDMSVMLGQDLKSSAIQLGKALNDPIQGVTALRRVGVQLSQEQENQIRQFMAVNDVAAAQKIILGELSTQMGGTARAAADTYLGSVAQLKNALGDLAETIGAYVTPALKTINQALTPIINKINEMIQKQRASQLIENVLDLGEKGSIVWQRYGNELEWTVTQYDKAGKAIKTWKEAVKEVKKTVDTGMTDGASKWREKYNELLKMNLDYEKKLASQSGDQLAVLAIEEQAELEKLEKLKTTNKEKYEKTRLDITKFYANERARIEKENDQKIEQSRLQLIQSSISAAQGMVSQLGAIFAQYAMNQSLALDNEAESRREAISEWYEEQKEILDSAVLSEKEKTKKLEALDQERARREKKLEEEIDKKKRKIEYEAAKRQKAINIVQSLMNTALGITNVWSRWAWNPPVAWTLTALVGALGMAQTALIAQQPLPKAAKGAYVEATAGGRPVIVGEGGHNEVIAPLTPEVYEELADGIVDKQREATIGRGAASQQVVRGDVYLYGEKIGEFISRGTEDGTIRIASRSVV